MNGDMSHERREVLIVLSSGPQCDPWRSEEMTAGSRTLRGRFSTLGVPGAESLDSASRSGAGVSPAGWIKGSTPCA